MPSAQDFPGLNRRQGVEPFALDPEGSAKEPG
jgi:hypothetical protein